MPYVDKETRELLNREISELLIDLEEYNEPGNINYVLSNIIWHLFNLNPCYETANSLLGVLEAVKQEFYRRKVAPYEDLKIGQNGDLEQLDLFKDSVEVEEEDV